MIHAIESLCILFLGYLFFFLYSIIFKKNFFFKPYGLEWSTCIKGIAITIIILGHLGNLFDIRYFTPLGAIGVSCFLIVSGYGLSTSYEKNGLKNYWTKKLPIYMIYVGIELIYYVMYWGEFTPTQIIKDILLISPLHPYGWYMNFIAVWYIVFFLSKKIRNERIQFVFLTLIAVIWYVFFRELKAQNAFSFLAGVILYKYRDCLLSKLEKIKTSLLFFSLGSLFLAIKQIYFVRELPVILYKVILIMICMSYATSLISLISFLQKYNKQSLLFPMYSLGLYSYELYLIHAFTILMFQKNSITFMSLFLFFLISFLLSILLHEINNWCIRITSKVQKGKAKGE